MSVSGTPTSMQPLVNGARRDAYRASFSTRIGRALPMVTGPIRTRGSAGVRSRPERPAQPLSGGDFDRRGMIPEVSTTARGRAVVCSRSLAQLTKHRGHWIRARSSYRRARRRAQRRRRGRSFSCGGGFISIEPRDGVRVAASKFLLRLTGKRPSRGAPRDRSNPSTRKNRGRAHWWTPRARCRTNGAGIR